MQRNSEAGQKAFEYHKSGFHCAEAVLKAIVEIYGNETSHDIPKIFDLADQIVILNKGEIDVFGSAQEIQWSAKPYIKEFFESTMNNKNDCNENRAVQ